MTKCVCVCVCACVRACVRACGWVGAWIIPHIHTHAHTFNSKGLSTADPSHPYPVNHQHICATQCFAEVLTNPVGTCYMKHEPYTLFSLGICWWLQLDWLFPWSPFNSWMQWSSAAQENYNVTYCIVLRRPTPTLKERVRGNSMPKVGGASGVWVVPIKSLNWKQWHIQYSF